MASNSSKGRRRRGRSDDTPDVKLSKLLSYICRHGAEKEGIAMHQGGYITVSEILSHGQRASQYSEEDVRRVVANCPKERFKLREDPDTGVLQIRANQGHSIQVEDLELIPIVNADDVPIVVHGTNKRAWQQIKLEGLNRMKRNHIHFATGLPEESGVISGMRSSSQVLIFINLRKALEDGYKFYSSANNVILCPGNDDGILPPPYFAEVKETHSGLNLLKD